MLISYSDALAANAGHFAFQPVSSSSAGYDGGVQAGSSINNVLSRQLAVPTRFEQFIVGPSIYGFELNLTFTGITAKVGMIALLAHTISQFTYFRIEGAGYDSGDIYTGLWTPPPVGSQFPRNLYFILPQEIDVTEALLILVGTADNTWNLGRLWAGRAFQPTYKTQRRDYTMKTMDDSVITRTIGQQVYADYRPRYRQLHVATLLTEDEAIGTEDGETQNLQDIGFEVGRAGEVIVLPSQANNQVIHKMGIYGHFLEAPSILLAETNAKIGRLYSSDFDVVEDR